MQLSKLQLSIDSKEKLDAYINARTKVKEEYIEKMELLEKNKIKGYSPCFSPLGFIGVSINYKDGTEQMFKGNFDQFIETLK
ncbi:MAG: hypothetical protein WAT79_08675 [Saprospiraceae bacterium]